MREFMEFLNNNFGSFFGSGADIFLWFFNRAVSAAFLILAVILLRLLLKKAPKWITCALWGICALRLVLPFSLQSALSLIPSAQTVVPESIYTQAPQIDSGIPVIDNNVNEYFAQETVPTIPDSAPEYIPDSIPDNIIPNESVATEPTAAFNFVSVLFVIWVVGIIALLTYAVVSYIKLKRRVKGASMLEKGVFESTGVASPFILGIFNPKIYLPLNMDEGTKAYVLAHEKAHLSRGDHILKPLGFVILSLYWFSPLVWLAYILFCRDIELACDEKVVSKLEKQSRADYAQALLSCAAPKRIISACPLAFGEVSVKDRVKSALHYKKPMLWVIIAAVITAVAVAVCFLTDPIKSIQAGADPDKDNTSSSITSGDTSNDNANSDISSDVESDSSDMQGNADKNTNNSSKPANSNNDSRPVLTNPDSIPWQNHNYDNKIAFAKMSGELSEVVRSIGSYYPGVTFVVKELDIGKVNPHITIEWHNDSNQYFEFNDNIGAYREYENEDSWVNYSWEDCKTNSVKFKNTITKVKPGDTARYTYSLKGFNLSKPGKHRITMGRCDEFWVDFFVSNRGDISNKVKIDYESETIDIGYGNENVESFIEETFGKQVSKYGTATYIPFTSITTKSRLDYITNCMSDVFDTKQYNGAIKKYDEKFFETKQLVMLMVRENSQSIQHHISGLSSEQGLKIIVTRFIPSKCNTVKSGRVILLSLDRADMAGLGQIQIYGSNIYHNGYAKYASNKKGKPVERPMYVEGVNSTISLVSPKGDSPTIRIYWSCYTGERVVVGPEFDIQRYENGKWISCAGDNVKFENETFILQHNFTRYESSRMVTYSLKGFDVSKPGKYRFIPPISGKSYYEFDLLRYPEYDNIDYKDEIIDIGYGGDDGCSALASIRENGSSEFNPLVRIDSVQKLNQVYDIMDDHFYIDSMEEAFQKCDEQFFKEKTIFFVCVGDGSSGITYKVKGVEDDGKGKCSLYIERSTRGGSTVMTGSAITLIVDRKTADSFKTFDVTIYRLGGTCVLV